MYLILYLCAISCTALKCNKQNEVSKSSPVQQDTSLVNTSHLDYLHTPVTFDGTKTAGVYIYAEAPDYHLTGANGEGYTCVDDVARAVFVYIRSPKFSSDTSLQKKAFSLVEFILKMQSANGYFYNFVLTGNQINTSGATSINTAGWWSWRALHALTEAGPLIKDKNSDLFTRVGEAINKLITRIKSDLVNLPQNTQS